MEIRSLIGKTSQRTNISKKNVLVKRYFLIIRFFLQAIREDKTFVTERTLALLDPHTRSLPQTRRANPAHALRAAVLLHGQTTAALSRSTPGFAALSPRLCLGDYEQRKQSNAVIKAASIPALFFFAQEQYLTD